MKLVFILQVLFLARTCYCNPFRGYPLYVQPKFRRDVQQTIEESPSAYRPLLEPLLNVSTAFWVDKRIRTDPSNTSDYDTVIGVLTDALSQSPLPIVTFVVYNLPNRDCNAKASAGEICCLKRFNGTCDYDFPTCNGGYSEYRTANVDVLTKTVGMFCDKVPMAFVIEPDSLPNLVTNFESPRCGVNATVFSYCNGIQYTVNALNSACPSASIYMDAAHGAWLGWDDTTEGFVKEIKALDISDKIRGFALNVANYLPLGVLCPELGYCNGGENADHPCCKSDACDLTAAYNPGFTILNYVEQLYSKAKELISDFEPRFIVDTSRNGIKNSRKDCDNWCNVKGAGIGTFPTTDTDHDLIDAYLWVKPPTESDGCTEVLPESTKCPRFDSACASNDSIGSGTGEPRAPEAGDRFPALLMSLVRNAAN